MFTTGPELRALCEAAWSNMAGAQLLEALANHSYRLGDLKENEQEQFDDEGFLQELFQGHTAIYEVLGSMRMHFEEGFPLLKVIAAAHPNTQATVLASLSRDSDPEVLWAVAGNPNATTEILNTIALDAQLPALLYELPNPWPDDRDDYPDGVRYAGEGAWEITDVPVGASMAGNRSIAKDVMQRVIDSSQFDMIKALLLRNSDRLTLPQWRSLLENGLEREASLTHYDATVDWLLFMADSSDVPPDIYQALLSTKWQAEILARRIVARNYASLDDLRLVLSYTPSAWTRARIARHPQITHDLLSALAVDPEPSVREAVIASPFATDEQRAMAALQRF